MCAKLRLIVACVNNKTTVCFAEFNKKNRAFSKARQVKQGGSKLQAPQKHFACTINTGTKGLTLYFHNSRRDGA